MAPKLRVLVSTQQGYPPSTPCAVNSAEPTKINTDGFEGDLWVFIEGYNGDLNKGQEDAYFKVKGREGMSYGIVVRGKYKKPFNADQLVFGNVFEKPIRDNLPWGTSIATKFMYFVDPTVEADIYADKPWALSPALATMAHLSLRDGDGDGDGGQKGEKKPYIEEDSLDWIEEAVEAMDIPSYSNSNSNSNEDEKAQISARRKWLTKSSNRQLIDVKEDTEVGMEFCNGLLDFNTLSATLPSPFNLQIPLLKYWDGQPVTYVCQDKTPSGECPVGAGSGGGGNKVHWSVAFEIVDEDAKAQLVKKGGEVLSHGEADAHSDDKTKASEDESEREAVG
ncbi:uncharacterized protein I303_104831 [Kwoniella dejecticola CBS 10117]|uniref:Domain of unknown function at the cortex 1 domain-containing protein n=1 Tax=Kwoniella dejecticola CBS 10117 TaxID=1296121 RepID=A0A1A6A483_9TREE|nr:uncharacterized protein I303_04188 [Kwoniella dejecticola CBS 10117]OBR84867.1 hypothetical protein I303_04188 [Kwoniella dejecticola CBS 10117]